MPKKFTSPLAGPLRVTSTFQDHKNDPGRTKFAGIDLVYADGNSYRRPIVATSRQKVLTVQNDFYDPKQPQRQGEKYVYTQDLNDPDYTFLYLHNDENQVSVGQILERGQQLALMGFSGWTVPDDSPQGTHLHYEVRYKGQREDPDITTDFYLSYTTSQNETQSNTMTNTITVQNGWGLSNVAAAAGLPINEDTYNQIYNLNQGWRGSTDWRSLNTRMGPGDVLKVRPDVQVTPVNNPVIDVNNEANEWKAKYDQAIVELDRVKNELKKQVEATNIIAERNEALSVKKAELEQAVLNLNNTIKDMEKDQLPDQPKQAEGWVYDSASQPRLDLPKEEREKMKNALADHLAKNIEQETGQKVESNQIVSFVGGRVQKLTSTRLWSAIGGTWLTAQIGDNATQTIISAIVLFSLYIISEAYIYYTNQNK